MIVEIHLKARAAKALLVCVATVCMLLARQVIFNFIVFSLSDSRSAVSTEALNVATDYFPSSARLNARSAEAQISDPARDLERASREIERAIGLSPCDYKLQVVLASVKESQHQIPAAETALRTAVLLAPSNIDVRWRLANLLLRSGKISDALVEFRTAVAANEALIPATLDLIWSVTSGDSSAVRSVVPTRTAAGLTLAIFLLKHGQTDEAARVFDSLDREARIAAPATGDFINSLTKSGDLRLARLSWIRLLSGSNDLPADAADTSIVWNGGFESDPVPGLAQFDWNLRENDYAAISVDNSMAHLGARSLRIDFAGRDTARLDGEIMQCVLLKPGNRYKLECYVRTRDLVAMDGPRLALRCDSDGGWAPTGPAIAPGTQDWQKIELGFVAPQGPGMTPSGRLDAPRKGSTAVEAASRDTALPSQQFHRDVVAVTVRLIRIPRFSYEEPMGGTIWLDDFRITRIG